ncbi:sugar phosphate isomerase/epimerase [Chengkuizengella axinellae]|uniref:Sugar phosphate isomerase/epimerase n=1 Tax=Chengkuizengella axinellae TaxID=3064388 RepID=A0ABT9IY16_9BACL|nr:sugar phosphate isomerase/epimerase [Chengkuizengella sp. 2205SS18-9]MDP5274220.1 sugar phosphate isomerase/epimerase [Chengkuizengella sp. 2205SS18-9]
MHHFLIGQHGSFDYHKFKRDFKDDFYGIEACLFSGQKDTLNLLKESKERGFQIGVHFPFRSENVKVRDALFLDQNEKTREKAYRWIQEELEFLTSMNPSYVLFHYPKPVLLDDRVDWSNWRFTDPSEFVFESSYSLDELIEHSESLFQWLTEKSEEFHFTPILEFDGLNRYVYETDFLEKLFEKYNHVKLCLDTGRLHFQDKLDPYFDPKTIIKKYGRFADLIHLWNVKVNKKIEFYHYPVLPELQPEDGWAPIEEYLGIIKKENKNIKILFEHRSELISDEDLERCYSWVDGIMHGKSEE